MAANTGRQLLFEQRFQLKEESASGTQIKPATDGTDAILVTALEINQATSSTPSDEINNSLNIKDQVQDQPTAGEFTASMYLRPKGFNATTKVIDELMGDVLLKTLYGSKLTFTATPGTADTSVTTIPFTALDIAAEEDIPQRGTIKVTVSGNVEIILYTGVTITPGGTPGDFDGDFTGCTRNYLGDGASAMTSGDTMSSGGHIYKQSLSRPSFSGYRDNNGTGKQGRGMVPMALSIDVDVNGYPLLTFTGGLMQQGISGQSVLNGDVSSSADLVLGSGEARKFSVGSIIQNQTAADTNTGAGYRVTVVNLTTDTITIESSVSWTSADIITGFLPVNDVSAFLDPLASKDTVVYFDGAAKAVTDTSISINAPVTFNDNEISVDPLSDFIADRRDITTALNVLLRPDEVVEYSDSINDVKKKIEFRFGDGTPGKTVWLIFPVCSIDAPVESVDQPGYSLALTATALDTTREDSAFLVVV